MPFLSKMVNLWRNIFRRRQVEQDLNDELQAYVEEMVERKVQAGIAPEAAREAVLLELGGMDRITELVREQRIGLGVLPKIGVAALIAIVAFAGGIGTALAAMPWVNPPEPVEPGYLKVVIDSENAPSRPRMPVLEGRVVDKATGEPIPFVEVGLEPSAPMRRYTYTDDQGNFSFTNPPATYRLGAGKQHWALGGVEVVQISELPQRPNKNLYLWSSNDIRVTNKEGQPIEGEVHSLAGAVFDRAAVSRPLEYRRFPYSTSIIELRTTNLPALKTGRAR
jgi:hypothetical protein